MAKLLRKSEFPSEPATEVAFEVPAFLRGTFGDVLIVRVPPVRLPRLESKSKAEWQEYKQCF